MDQPIDWKGARMESQSPDDARGPAPTANDSGDQEHEATLTLSTNVQHKLEEHGDGGQCSEQKDVLSTRIVYSREQLMLLRDNHIGTLSNDQLTSLDELNKEISSFDCNWKGARPKSEDWKGAKPKSVRSGDWEGTKPIETHKSVDCGRTKPTSYQVDDRRGLSYTSDRGDDRRGLSYTSDRGDDRRGLSYTSDRGDDRRGLSYTSDRGDDEWKQGTWVRGQTGGGGFRTRTTRELDTKGLQGLLEKEPSSIVMALGVESGLSDLLQRSNQTPNMMFELLKVLVRACSCTSAPESLFRIVLTVHDSRFYDIVTDILKKINTEPNQDIDEKRQFLKNVLIFMKELSSKLPHSFMSVKVLGLLGFLGVVVHNPEMGEGIIDEEIPEMLREMNEFKTTTVDLVKKGHFQSKGRDATQGPPDDFRDYPVFPTAEDLYLEEPTYLRKNIAHGGYRDLDHYLDVQFRLLREDFICPLREGIQEYQASLTKGQRPRDIKVYLDVEILETVCSEQSGLVHRISFDVSKLKRLNWEHSKRLLYGSLLCLSNDDFKTCVFASVIERRLEDVKNGIICVHFENLQGFEEQLSLKTIRFVMVETTAYFEAYKHVLKGLQMIRPGDLPFERYIVSCENYVQPPHYLQTEDSPKYDLRPLVDDKIIIRGDRRLRAQIIDINDNFNVESTEENHIEILDHQEWPPANLLQLDQSQYQALKTALTKEFVIIQGPPGTGKTYVGLKIVKALLHNAHVWNNEQRSPMLIVCYTNHALDQFLEGILDFFSGDIIRVGGRSKSDRLDKYSLKNKRYLGAFGVRDDLGIATFQRNELRSRVNILEDEIETRRLQVEATENVILDEYLLRPFMGFHFMNMSRLYSKSKRQSQRGASSNPKSAMVEWLGLGNINDLINTVKHETDDEAEANDRVAKDVEGVLIQGEAERIQQERRLDDDDIPFATDRSKVRMTHIVIRQNVAFDISNFDKEQENGENSNVNWKCTHHSRKALKRKLLKKLRNSQRMTDARARRVRYILRLKMDDRWMLYRYWVHQLREKLRTEINEREMTYRTTVAQYKESQMLVDKLILQKATVIGMTTSGAARYQQHLSEIGPKIVVVEEAAEVLEGHIVTTLSSKCEHLILIGDHKQLKPNPTVYKLAKNFNLDLSLFERMINNGVHCDTLALQHRMRPEIAVLIKHIYPKLQNHSSVLHYDNIKGVSENMYFINHDYQEDLDTERMSHSNDFEASYIVSLCKYLLKQGYLESQITVLTTYSGQLIKLRKKMPKYEFDGVKLTTVDNFQGEENDIILLSLVRSNKEGNVGFLKTENRVCVALSRAKKGLFVLGNFNLLVQQSLLWRKIVEDVRKEGRFDTTLKLSCQNHPQDVGIMVGKAEDFQRIPEGGCMKPCTYRLDCGHVCSLLCHPYDAEHKEYLCHKPCVEIVCENGHQCKKLCHEKCGDCPVPILKTIPLCGHQQMVPCSQDPSTFDCRILCEKICENDHTRHKLCYQEWGECSVPIEKIIPSCGHSQRVPCSQKPEMFDCEFVCRKVCENGHQCRKKCHQDWSKCPALIEKIIPSCGHRQNVPCSQKPESFDCKYSCVQICENDHHRQKFCYQSWDDCLLPVEKTIPTCGHKQIVPCSDPAATFECEMVCEDMCVNGHPCQKLCFQKWSDCLVPIEKIIPGCGHNQMVPCSQSPSTYDCEMVCERECENGHPHEKFCYQTWVDCSVRMNKVITACGHEQMMDCSQNPTTVTCQTECQKTLKCGHGCWGKCGEAQICQVKVEKMRTCGHTERVECGHKTPNTTCTAKCSTKLKCGHLCSGSCKECHKGRLHVACKQICNKTLICGHERIDVCVEGLPCAKTCENRCSHDKCHKKCDELCSPCSKPCTWKCEHYSCTRTCSEPCDRPPCNERCPLLLPCGHPCIGLCGEPCPRLCRECNSVEVNAISAGANADAMFVELEDCKHIIEVTTLDKHMKTNCQSDTELELKTCPKCKTPIRRNVRYGTDIKTVLRNIEKAKETYQNKVISLKRDIEEDTKTGTVTEQLKKAAMVKWRFTPTENNLIVLQHQFQFTNKESKMRADYQNLGISYFSFGFVNSQNGDFVKELDMLKKWIMHPRRTISEQEQYDFRNEVLRHESVIRLLKVEDAMKARKVNLQSPLDKYHRSIRRILCSGKPYTEQLRAKAKLVFNMLEKHISDLKQTGDGSGSSTQ